jgi:hypothetical protein
MQDLLANLSAKRITLQHIPAKPPSPVLTMVDFVSRNPVPCTLPTFTVCKQAENRDITFFGRADQVWFD